MDGSHSESDYDADAFEDGSPYEYFSEKDAKRAIQIAEEIIGFIRGEIGKHV